MKIEIDLSELIQEEPNYGQVIVRIPKSQEDRFRLLNVKHNKKLSMYMRKFLLSLMDKIEQGNAA